MNILSLVYCIVSLAVIISVIVIVVIKQFELASSAVYYFLILLFGLIGWIASNLVQIVISKPGNESTALIFSRIATVCSMIAMIAAVLFARVLSARRTLNSKSVAFAFTLFGGTIAMTFAKAVYDVSYNTELDFIVTEAHIVWVIFDAGLVLFAGTIMVYYFGRQRKFVEEQQKKVINFMIIGAFIAFFLSGIFYAIYAVAQVPAILHLELVTVAIGTSMVGIGMIWGGKRTMYGSSRVLSVHVFDTNGLSVYAGLFIAEYDVDEHLISGVATAIANFAGHLIGKDVFPREIDLENYSLMLEKKGDYVGFVNCEFPTVQVRQALCNVMDDFEPQMGQEEITELVEKYFPYGKPRIMEFDEVPED